MGAFAKLNLKGAKVGQGGVYFLEGDYLVEVDCIKPVNKRTGGQLFIAECMILESTNEKRKVGTRCNVAEDVGTDWGPGNIKEFLGAASGVDPRDEEAMGQDDWDAILEDAIGDEQPLKGAKVKVHAFLKLKKGMPDIPENYRVIKQYSPVTE